MSKKNKEFELFGHQGKGKYSQTPHSLKELIDSRGRRLILLISDCISDSWRNGDIQFSLQLWTKKPTTFFFLIILWV